jgi:hypothetical protein
VTGGRDKIVNSKKFPETMTWMLDHATLHGKKNRMGCPRDWGHLKRKHQPEDRCLERHNMFVFRSIGSRLHKYRIFLSSVHCYEKTIIKAVGKL